MNHLQVELLGPLLVTFEGNDQPLDGAKKVKALVVFLSSHKGRTLSRDVLAELLWPGRFEIQAQQSLRQALSGLRRMLGDTADTILETADGGVSISSDAVLIDVDELEKLKRSEELADLQRALDLYRGDFLEGFPAVSADFDHWVEQERVRLKGIIVPLAESLIAKLENRSELERATEAASRLVAIDPAHEAGHRHLIRLYAQQGQKTAALRQFESCKRCLADLLDAEPEPATLALVENIRNGNEVENIREGVDATHAPQSVDSSTEEANAYHAPVKDTRHTAHGRSGFIFKWGAIASVVVMAIWAGISTFGGGETYLMDASSPELTCADLRPTSISREPVLLILPIRSHLTDPSARLFAASATDALLSMASTISGVTSLAGPFFGHPDEGLPTSELVTKNAASHVLESSIGPDIGGQRVTMRIVEGPSGRQIWQNAFVIETPVEDPGRVQNEVSIRAARGIQAHLTDGSQALVYKSYEPESLSVFEHNTRGFGYLSQIKPIFNDLARKEFEAVLTMDPDNVSANTGMGFSYVSPVLFRWQGAEASNIELAARHAAASAKADPQYAPARSLLAIIHLFDGDYDLARQLLDEALRLSGSGADATAFAGYVLSFTDRQEQSLELAQRSMRLRPYTSPLWYQWIFARALRQAGNIEGAITCLEEIDYNEQGIIAPALELVRAYVASGETGMAAPYVSLIGERTNGMFSSTRYCQMPAYQAEANTELCIKQLVMAGLPE